MKALFVSCPLLITLLFTACSTPKMESIAADIQQTRTHNALHAKNARIRVWKNTSTFDAQGWHLHSDQINNFTLPPNEFKTVRYLLITHGYTTWQENDSAHETQTDTAPDCIIELEWLNKDGETTSGIDLTGICRESCRQNAGMSSFPFVLTDEAYEQFFALPTVKKAMDIAGK